MTEPRPGGWYENPLGDGLRYWDGAEWTDQVATPHTEDLVPTPLAAKDPPGGWYANPEGGGLRYWDGSRWTDHFHRETQAIPPSASTSPAPLDESRQTGAGSDFDAASGKGPFTPGRLALAGLAGVAVLAAAIAVVSGGSDDDRWIEAVERRLDRCGLARENLGLAFDRARVIPNDELTIGNTGEPPDSDEHFVRVPMESVTAAPNDTSNILFAVSYSEEGGYVITEAGRTDLLFGCMGSDEVLGYPH